MDERNPSSDPVIIQGGMGAAVSSWPLARAVALTGQLGVVSGTGIDAVLCRRLQLGDPAGHIRRALSHFPMPGVARRICDRYFIPGGKLRNVPFAVGPKPGQELAAETAELLVAANFVEVFLAKEGHGGLVGINYLEKIQTVLLPSLFGAMLAGADYVLVGAGIPRAVPGALDRLSEGDAVEMPLHVEGATSEDSFTTRFDPRELFGNVSFPIKRPKFLAIVSSTTLATMLARKASGRVDGFVVEGASAGGHNAPPRGEVKYNHRGEPIYTHRDMVDLSVFRSLGLPFWLAGSCGAPSHLAEAIDEGATGIQVGTAFAFCEESGLEETLKHGIIEMARRHMADVLTDPLVSPTGFPFKVLQYPETLSQQAVYDKRRRVCDLGYLRHAYRTEDGKLAWRCPAEAVDCYVEKGGDADDTRGRKCLCNALLSTVGLDQARPDGVHEPPIITCGDDVDQIIRFLPTPESGRYTAHDVVTGLLAEHWPRDPARSGPARSSEEAGDPEEDEPSHAEAGAHCR